MLTKVANAGTLKKATALAAARSERTPIVTPAFAPDESPVLAAAAGDDGAITPFTIAIKAFWSFHVGPPMLVVAERVGGGGGG